MRKKKQMKKRMVFISGILAVFAVCISVSVSRSQFLWFGRKTAEEERAEELMEKSPSRRGMEIDQMVSEDPESAAKIIEKLLEEEEETRQKALLINELGRTGREEAAEVIKPYLKSEDEQVRLSAAAALAGLGKPKTAEVLGEVALDENARRSRRSMAIRSLEKIKTRESIEILEAVLGDEDSSLRFQAVMSLGRIGTDESLSAMEAARGDSREDIRNMVERFLEGKND